MIIETKFSIGQNVWLMHENNPLEMTIISIHPASYEMNRDGKALRKDVTRYGLKRAKETHDPYSGYGNQPPKTEYEYKLFASKKDLCLSFLDEEEKKGEQQ